MIDYPLKTGEECTSHFGSHLSEDDVNQTVCLSAYSLRIHDTVDDFAIFDQHVVVVEDGIGRFNVGVAAHVNSSRDCHG